MSPHRKVIGEHSLTEGKVRVSALRDRGCGGGYRKPHVEIAIHWSPVNIQCVPALVDTGAECSLIHGNPEWFPGTPTITDGYGRKAE